METYEHRQVKGQGRLAPVAYKQFPWMVYASLLKNHLKHFTT